MIIFDTLNNLPPEAKDCVIAVGNFDGVHLGHQALIKNAAAIAKNKEKKLGVLTFEPHPRQLFQPDQPPGRITPMVLKAERLKLQNIDYLFSLKFDWPFASQSAESFIKNILLDGLNAAHIIVGEDFRFGQLRKGSTETIEAAGIPIEKVNPIQDNKGEIVSSSRIRQLLRNGYINEANTLLGWSWEIQGHIFRGDRRGHELGYPTANILLKDTLHPAYGIYACKIQIEGEEQWRNAATNIGIRPMFEVAEGQVEAHILDYPDRDIYNKFFRVQPVARIRSEAKFDSLENLIQQIERDCQQVREILK